MNYINECPQFLFGAKTAYFWLYVTFRNQSQGNVVVQKLLRYATLFKGGQIVAGYSNLELETASSNVYCENPFAQEERPIRELPAVLTMEHNTTYCTWERLVIRSQHGSGKLLLQQVYEPKIVDLLPTVAKTVTR
jgi:hypothetical protein